ncbi:MAG: hypothetical protein GY754_30070 [bacterium]|nr:hypothetical protein [bacterium]
MKKITVLTLFVLITAVCTTPQKKTYSWFLTDAEIKEKIYKGYTWKYQKGMTNWIPLHKNPRKGDFATYIKMRKGPHGKMLITKGYEIVSVKNNEIVIRFTNYGVLHQNDKELQQLLHKKGDHKQAPGTHLKTKDLVTAKVRYGNHLHIDYHCDKEGNVKEAYLVNNLEDEKIKLRISKGYTGLRERTIYKKDPFKKGINYAGRVVKTSSGTYVSEGQRYVPSMSFTTGQVWSLKALYTTKVPFQILDITISDNYHEKLVNAGNRYAPQKVVPKKTETVKIRKKYPVGVIKMVRGKTVLVGSGTAARDLRMGMVIYCFIGGQRVPLRVVFPMMSVARCSVDKRYIRYVRNMRPGIRVYR